MKKLVLIALALALAPVFAQAEQIKSADTQVNLGRVVELVQLSANDDDVQVNMAVVDQGGSTDMAPTQAVYLTMYRKGEMFSTDATFEIGTVNWTNSAKAIKEGVYELTLTGMESDGGIEEVTYVVDATKALADIKALECGDEFDCDASNNFSSTIEVVRK